MEVLIGLDKVPTLYGSESGLLECYKELQCIQLAKDMGWKWSDSYADLFGLEKVSAG